MLGPNEVRHRSAASSPSESTQALPSGSVIVSFSSWLIVDSAGSAVLPFGRGSSDRQCGRTALYGMTAYRIRFGVSE